MHLVLGSILERCITVLITIIFTMISMVTIVTMASMVTLAKTVTMARTATIAIISLTLLDKLRKV